MPKRGDTESRDKIAITETGSKLPAFEFADLAAIQEYLTWKQEVPLPIRRLVESALKGNAPTPSQNGLPLTDQFLDTFGMCVNQKQLIDLASVNKKVANFLRPLSRVPTEEGYIDVFDTLANPETSWSLKQKIYETQIKPALEWLANRDLRDLAQAAKKSASEPGEGESSDVSESGQQPNDGVPPANEKVISSMEAGAQQKENKEGQPAVALFSIKPFFGGYYEQLVFNKFNQTTLQWEKDPNEFTEAQTETLDPLNARVYFGKIRGNEPLALPTPDDWIFDPDSLEIDAPDGTAEVVKNQNGHWYLNVAASGIFNYQLRLGKKPYFEESEKFKEAEMSGELPAELKQFITEIKASRLPIIKQKREIVKFVRNHLKYSNSREAWEYYTAKPAEYFTRIWERGEADCKVANDLACRALAEIDNDFQYVAGFYVKEKGQDGEAVLHSGNGHAWLKIWDHISRRAIKLDATPKGDPTIDQEEQERELEGETGEGDYNNPEEEIASEEDAKKQLKEMKKKDEGREGKPRSPEHNQEEQSFAKLAECTPEQAREFLKALDRVREIKDEQGIPISDLMKEEWKKIIEERKVDVRDYRGPVPMDEGDRLEDPVEARIDIRSHDFNPGGFEVDEIVQKTVSDFGGLNIYFSFDLSGSMREPDGASGRIKADVQRDVGLLFVDSLMQCSYIARQAGADSDLLPIKIMVTLASDHGEVKLPLTDQWGEKEQWAFYSALTKLASGGTPTH
ncbi:MAG: hypothetical protein AAB390_01560 [Patescibacteria group bacterium]